MENFSAKTNLRIAFALAAVAVMLALTVGSAFWAFTGAEDAARARKHTSEVLDGADAFLLGLKDAETGQRGFLLTGDEAFLAPYTAERYNATLQLEALRQRTKIDEARNHLNAVVPLLNARMLILSQTIALYRGHRVADALEMVRAGQGKRLMDSIRFEMSRFRQLEAAALAKNEARFQSNLHLLFAVIATAGLFAFLLMLAFAWLVYRETQSRLRDLLLTETQHSLALQEQSNQKLQQLNAALQASEEKLSVTLNSIGDGVIATDAQGHVVILNPLAEQLTGWTLAEAANRPMEEVFHIINQETRQSAPIPVADTLAYGTLQALADDTILVARDGTECAIADSCSPIRDRTGQVVGAVLVFRDVAEIKRFERSLQEKNVELERASHMKSEFLATMSHELRTPLNAIIGFSEALKDGLIGELSDAQKEYVGDIFTSGRHLLSLINDILDLSKVEAGMMTLELDPVDIKSLLQNSLSILKEKAATQRIDVKVQAGEDLGVPRLDMRKTKQIVYNLLSNAVKFTPDGGHVKLSARRVARSEVGVLQGDWLVRSFLLAESDYQEFLEISVQDSGIGIAEKNLDKLFQPFSQIDSSLARKYGGTGLGLAMVRQMAELHGGAVAVASAEGQGSIFAAWLPIRDPEGAATAAPPPQAPSPKTPIAATGERMALVVEDDSQSGDLLELLLHAEGFHILRAASAEEALLLAPQQPLSLITLDIQLPGMNGWTFLEHLRKNDGPLASVPVVVVAALDYGDMALVRGAGAVLQKPVSRVQLKTAIDHLGLPQLRDHVHTVLVVDNDPKAVEVIATFLPSPAYAVVRAYGGTEAIALARRVHPDLILLDLMMPDVTGFDVVHALQRDVDTAHIPIVVVTAKQVTEQDRAMLNQYAGGEVHIVEKAGFEHLRFIGEVRRALAPKP